MRRELKGIIDAVVVTSGTCHKAYPDEKGTERLIAAGWLDRSVAVTRHIPMRRELKDTILCQKFSAVPGVTRHIPMRRELKDDSAERSCHPHHGGSQGISR